MKINFIHYDCTLQAICYPIHVLLYCHHFAKKNALVNIYVRYNEHKEYNEHVDIYVKVSEHLIDSQNLALCVTDTSSYNQILQNMTLSQVETQFPNYHIQCFFSKLQCNGSYRVSK